MGMAYCACTNGGQNLDLRVRSGAAYGIGPWQSEAKAKAALRRNGSAARPERRCGRGTGDETHSADSLV